jgi:hypothetical protein
MSTANASIMNAMHISGSLISGHSDLTATSGGGQELNKSCTVNCTTTPLHVVLCIHALEAKQGKGICRQVYITPAVDGENWTHLLKYIWTTICSGTPSDAAPGDLISITIPCEAERHFDIGPICLLYSTCNLLYYLEGRWCWQHRLSAIRTHRLMHSVR